MSDTALDIPTGPMTGQEFVAWDEARMDDETRVEFHDGHIVTMRPESLRHNFAKASISNQFINRLGFEGHCSSMSDGMRLRTPTGHRYEPDAMIRCGERLGGDSNLVTDPVVVVEVLSPSNTAETMDKKEARYFACPSVAHYLLVDPVSRTFRHVERGTAEGKLLTALMRGGSVFFDPPGVTPDLDAVLAAVDAA